MCEDCKNSDVDSARKSHHLLLKSNDKVAAHFIYWFSWFWSITSVAYFFSITFLVIPPGADHFADIILGFLLGTAVATIIGFFFGNSSE